MNDYLWDKTGEVDAEAERLEEMLSQFRFQPRTFEVPATLPIVPRRPARSTGTYSWTRLAVAASVLLALLAGTWLVLKQQQRSGAPVQMAKTPSNEATPQTAKQTQPVNQGQAATAPSNDATAGNKERGRQEVADAAQRNVERHQRRVDFVAASVKRLGARRRQSNKRDLTVREEVAAMTPQEKEAVEKFMLAMKVTSEKLGYAERQVAGLNERSPQR